MSMNAVKFAPGSRPNRAAILVALCAWTLSALVQAQTETAPASATFPVLGFEIQGDNPLPESEVKALLRPYVRNDATLQSLQDAVGTFERQLNVKGYALHRVVLAPQDVGGAIKLNVVSFKIARVEVEGNRLYSVNNILASIPEMREGQTPNFNRLSVQTAMANENSGKKIKVALKESDDQDHIEARVSVIEGKPWSLLLSVDNTGSPSTGNDRITLTGSHANVLGQDHQFTAAYTSSAQGKDVKQIGLSYKVPLYGFGGMLGASLTHSNVVGDFGAFQSSGIGQTMGISYSHYLPAHGGLKRYVNLSLDNKEFGITTIDGLPLPGQQARLSRPVTLAYVISSESDRAIWNVSAGLALNLHGGNGNRLTAYQSEDPRVETANWRAVRASGSLLMPVANGWTLNARAQLQYSAQVLIAGEQFGLGGSNSVRGTTERPISGDSGLLLSAEINMPPLQPGLNAIGFVDAGWVGNHKPNENKLGIDRLVSAGLGLQYVRGNLTAKLNYGRLLVGSDLPAQSGLAIPAAGDQRLHLHVSVQF